MTVVEALSGMVHERSYGIDDPNVELVKQESVFLNPKDTRAYLNVYNRKILPKDENPLILKIRRADKQGADELLPAKQFVRREDGTLQVVEGFSSLMEIYKGVKPWEIFYSLSTPYGETLDGQTMFDMIHEGGVTDQILDLARAAAEEIKQKQLQSRQQPLREVLER